MSLPEEGYEAWLRDDLHDAESLLVPYPASEMQGYRVSKVVNLPSVDGAELRAIIVGQRTWEFHY